MSAYVELDVSINLEDYVHQLTDKDKESLGRCLFGGTVPPSAKMLNKFIEGFTNSGSSMHELEMMLSSDSKEALRRMLN